MIGGDMASIESPNDALFFLHHVRIDYLWRTWQAANPQHRLMDYSGNLANADEYDGPFKASLDDKLRYYNLIPDLRVSDVMNMQGGTLCYKVSLQSRFKTRKRKLTKGLSLQYQ
jgi:tyrosinase